MAPHVPCTRGRVAPARHGREGPQLAVAAWELNLSLTSSGALRDGPRAAPSEAPIPVVLAQRMRRLAYKLGPGPEATSGGRTRHRLLGALAPGAAVARRCVYSRQRRRRRGDSRRTACPCP